MERILEVLGEGGSITLANKKDNYFFTTEELAFENEFEIKDLKSDSDLFPDFSQAMLAMLKKYPVFKLHPGYVNEQFRATIKIYFDNYLLYNEDEENWAKDKWKTALG
jgi:hypothetical protein